MANTEPIIITPSHPMTMDEAVQYMRAIDRMYPIFSNRPTVKWFDANTGNPVTIGYTSG